MTISEKLNELANDFEALFGGAQAEQFSNRIRALAKQNASVPEDAQNLAHDLRILANNSTLLNDTSRVAMRHSAYTIENYAREIERLNKLVSAASNNCNELAKIRNDLVGKLNAAEARCADLEKERDELNTRLHVNPCALLAECIGERLTKDVSLTALERDEARAQVASLSAENAVLREATRRLRDLFDYEACKEVHVDLDYADAILSTPSPAAERMLHVVKAARAWRRAGKILSGAEPSIGLFYKRCDELVAAIDALTDGEQ